MLAGRRSHAPHAAASRRRRPA